VLRDIVGMGYNDRESILAYQKKETPEYIRKMIEEIK